MIQRVSLWEVHEERSMTGCAGFANKQPLRASLPPSFHPFIHPLASRVFNFFFRDGNVPVPREINSEIPSERRRTWRGLVNFSPLYIFFYYPLILFLSQGDGRILWMRINLNDWQQRGVQLVKYLSFFSFFFFFFLESLVMRSTLAN